MDITEVPALLQAVLLTVLMILAIAAVVSGGLIFMSRLESALPKSVPDSWRS
jgi:hypothetical protein